jgi:glycosyltransferase involved in cell wall biosynthesis
VDLEGIGVRPLFVSVILPCRNEVKHIASCLTSIIDSDFPKGGLELLVVDGQSEDGTREKVLEFSKHHPWIRLVDNVRKITPVGMNIGIRSSKGQIVIRIDAHSVYPSNYISSLVAWLMKSNADNVGGICITRPANETPKAEAIAFALSHPWGVGNSHFRIGADEPKWVDTVPFGCYKREVFDRIGLFNEALVRNQDDELNHRLIKHGGRILLVPEITSFYMGRESLQKLWVMYYQYGYFKPLAARVVGAVMTVRQLVPSIFVASLVLTAFFAMWSYSMTVLFSTIAIAYVALDVLIAVRAAFVKGVRCGLWAAVVFPILHVSYGFGYLKGILDFLILRKREAPDPLALSVSR